MNPQRGPIHSECENQCSVTLCSYEREYCDRGEKGDFFTGNHRARFPEKNARTVSCNYPTGDFIARIKGEKKRKKKIDGAKSAAQGLT